MCRLNSTITNYKVSTKHTKTVQINNNNNNNNNNVRREKRFFSAPKRAHPNSYSMGKRVLFPR
jgi:hypothetical protein